MDIYLRSCEKEIFEPIEGVVKGEIPQWISGNLLRNGPGNIKFGDMEYKHLFDSSALIQKFHINNGRITYQCRFIKSEIYKKNRIANKIVMTEFGTKSVPDPCSSIFARFMIVFRQQSTDLSDNTVISIYPFGDEIVGMTETAIINKIDPKSLDTNGRIDLTNEMGLLSHSAHPFIQEDGSIYNIGIKLTSKGPAYVICHFPYGKNILTDAKIVAKLHSRWKLHPAYMHSFGITENYFIVIEQPMTLSAVKVIKNRVKSDPIISSLKWFENKKTFIYLIDRKTGNVKYKFRTDAFFFMHTINQYECDNHVILDICCYQNGSMLNYLYVESLRNQNKEINVTKIFRAKPIRFVLPLVNRKYKKIFKKKNLVYLKDSQAEAYYTKKGKIFCIPEMICDVGCEAPRIYNEKFQGKDYQYFYGLHFELNPDLPAGLVKVDVKQRTKIIWCDKNCQPSEPIFVPKPNGTTEDDGIILSSLCKYTKENENYSGVVIICAKTMIEIGRCEFKTFSSTPCTFHGWFFPQ